MCKQLVEDIVFRLSLIIIILTFLTVVSQSADP